MIIIEGPDGSGKTTLARRLATDLEDLGVTLFESTGEVPPDPMGKALNALRSYFDWVTDPENNRPVIYDRLLLSEYVYGGILRGEYAKSCDHRTIGDLWQFFQHLRIPQIHCLPPFEAVAANIAGSDQLAGVDEHAEEIYSLYDDVFHKDWETRHTPQRGTHPMFLWDYTNLAPSGWKLQHGDYGFELRPIKVSPHDWLHTQYDDILTNMRNYIVENDRAAMAPEINRGQAIAQMLSQAGMPGGPNIQVMEIPVPEAAHSDDADHGHKDKKETLL